MNKEQMEALSAVEAQLEDLPLEQRWDVLEKALEDATRAPDVGPRRNGLLRMLLLAARELSADMKELTAVIQKDRAPASPRSGSLLEAYVKHGAQPPPSSYKESLEKVKAADQIFSVREKVGTIGTDLLETLMNELDNQREWAFGGHAVNSSWVNGEVLYVELDTGKILELGFVDSEANPLVSRSEKLKALSSLCKELGYAAITKQEQKETLPWSVVAFTRVSDEEYEYTRHFETLMRAYADGLHQLKHFGGKVVLIDETNEATYEAVDVEAWRRIFEVQGLACRHQDFRECDDKCPGWFINMDTYEVERCDNCERFKSDIAAAEHVNGCVREYEESKAMGFDRQRWKVTVDVGSDRGQAVQQFHRVEDAEAAGKAALKNGAKAVLLQDLRFKNEWAWASSEAEWQDRVTDVMQEQWNDDLIQFPRLLTELLMAGDLTSDGHKEFFSVAVQDICDSMTSPGCDITWEDVTEIFNRAQDAYEDMK